MMRTNCYRKIIAVIMTAVLIILTASIGSVSANTITSAFAGGSGVEGDPYLIETKDQLNNVRNNLKAHYKLISNIEFSDSDFNEGGAFYNSGQGWLPIGRGYTYFSGVFDGNGYVIKNMCIRITDNSYVRAGLFNGNKGEIRNLGMLDSEITVLSTGSNSVYAGSIVGDNEGIIEGCYNTGMIYVDSTHSIAGGIAGYNRADIRNCYNLGAVVSKNSESAVACAGGIVGWNEENINMCYSIGIAEGKQEGAIAGYNDSKGIVNCYYLDNMDRGTGLGDTDGSTKCNSDHLLYKNTFGGFDFDNVWTMDGDEDYLYPELMSVPIDFEKRSIGISVTQMPAKTEYYTQIENFDVKDGKIALFYNNGTYEEIDITNEMVSTYDKMQVGTQTLFVTYGDYTTTFDVKCLPLVYDSKITTDETLTLSYSASEDFDWELSDGSIAQITDVSSSTVSLGSYFRKDSSTIIVPKKTGYVAVNVVSASGKILTKHLVWFVEGEHQMEFKKTLVEASCDENEKALYCCKFCEYTEEIETEKTDHVWGEAVLGENGEYTCRCNLCKSDLVQVLLGDANMDGIVNIKDATLIQKHVAKISTIIDEALNRSDANSDAIINVKDATSIQKYIAKIDTRLSIGEFIDKT